MKALLPLTLLICCLQLSTAQVTFDSTLADTYHEKRQNLPDRFRERLLKLEEQMQTENNGGLLFFSLMSLDTLNKDSLKIEKPSSVKIASSRVPGLDTSLAEEGPNLDAPGFFLGAAEIVGDTLIITATDIFNRTITNLVHRDSVKAMYTGNLAEP